MGMMLRLIFGRGVKLRLRLRVGMWVRLGMEGE